MNSADNQYLKATNLTLQEETKRQKAEIDKLTNEVEKLKQSIRDNTRLLTDYRRKLRKYDSSITVRVQLIIQRVK